MDRFLVIDRKGFRDRESLSFVNENTVSIQDISITITPKRSLKDRFAKMVMPLVFDSRNEAELYRKQVQSDSLKNWKLHSGNLQRSKIQKPKFMVEPYYPDLFMSEFTTIDRN